MFKGYESSVSHVLLKDRGNTHTLEVFKEFTDQEQVCVLGVLGEMDEDLKI